MARPSMQEPSKYHVDEAEDPQIPTWLCLCLGCKDAGHHITDCPVSPIQASFRKKEEACQKVNFLDIFNHKDPDQGSVSVDLSGLIAAESFKIDLGTASSTLFRRNCPSCRLLHAIVPQITDHVKSIELGAMWSFQRLEPAARSSLLRQKYALFLTGSARNQNSRLDPHYGAMQTSNWDDLQKGVPDAIGMLADDASEPRKAMNARIVLATEANYELILKWIKSCIDMHSISCHQQFQGDFSKTRLIDVADRRVVQYPEGEHVDYIALSYVWGGGAQRRYPLGSYIGELPKTIEDAITAVKKLGKKYVWVDYVCIDQQDEAQKLSQISNMDIIYGGAFATIVALSGATFNAGLPRVAPGNKSIPQKQEVIQGKTFLTVMPTLLQQIRESTWATRAWTLQEGMLSARCLYFTPYQVYFECNSIQCCESIDESTSPLHGHEFQAQGPGAAWWKKEDIRQFPLQYPDPNSTIASTYNQNRPEESSSDSDVPKPMIRNPFSEAELRGRGVFRDPYVKVPATIPSESRRLRAYQKLIHDYTTRKMTNPSDSINAVFGVLKKLGKVYYPGGFWWGIPKDDFRLALLWRHSGPSQRRENFPSWSWAGWEGEVKTSYERKSECPQGHWRATPFYVPGSTGFGKRRAYWISSDPGPARIDEYS